MGIQDVTHLFPVYKFYSNSSGQGDRRHDSNPHVYGRASYSEGGDPFGSNTKPVKGSFNKLQSSTSAQSQM